MRLLAITLFGTLAFFTAPASCLAAEPAAIGRVVFASGDAQVIDAHGSRAAAERPVYEGAQLRTGREGYLYVRTDDGGFFILRPNSQGRIVRYHSGDGRQAAEYRLELSDGSGRVVTGAGPKAAPERFRLNTPVAAIGVRGTDFTVQTTSALTRAWVESGRIVLAALGSDCLATALGPCSGSTSLELSPLSLKAAEVRADLPGPHPLPSELQSPQGVSPRGPSEPATVPSNGTKHEPAGRASPTELAHAAAVLPALVELPPRTLRWGRWQALAEATSQSELAAALASGAQWMAIGPTHAIVRELTPSLTLPREGSAEFVLNSHEGSFINEKTGQSTVAHASQASLRMDFVQRSFTTTLTLSGKDQPTTVVSASGAIEADGRFVSAPLSTSHVAGALGGSSGQEAAYLYLKRIDAEAIVSGVTHWGR